MRTGTKPNKGKQETKQTHTHKILPPLPEDASRVTTVQQGRVSLTVDVETAETSARPPQDHRQTSARPGDRLNGFETVKLNCLTPGELVNEPIFKNSGVFL